VVGGALYCFVLMGLKVCCCLLAVTAQVVVAQEVGVEARVEVVGLRPKVSRWLVTVCGS
jgi:hypothetical protein